MFSIAIDVYDNKKNILIKSSPYRRCMQRLYQIAHVQTLHCTRTDVALQRLYNIATSPAPYRRCTATSLQHNPNTKSCRPKPTGFFYKNQMKNYSFIILTVLISLLEEYTFTI